MRRKIRKLVLGRNFQKGRTTSKVISRTIRETEKVHLLVRPTFTKANGLMGKEKDMESI